MKTTRKAYDYEAKLINENEYNTLNCCYLDSQPDIIYLDILDAINAIKLNNTFSIIKVRGSCKFSKPAQNLNSSIDIDIQGENAAATILLDFWRNQKAPYIKVYRPQSGSLLRTGKISFSDVTFKPMITDIYLGRNFYDDYSYVTLCSDKIYFNGIKSYSGFRVQGLSKSGEPFPMRASETSSIVELDCYVVNSTIEDPKVYCLNTGFGPLPINNNGQRARFHLQHSALIGNKGLCYSYELGIGSSIDMLASMIFTPEKNQSVIFSSTNSSSDEEYFGDNTNLFKIASTGYNFGIPNSFNSPNNSSLAQFTNVKITGELNATKAKVNTALTNNEDVVRLEDLKNTTYTLETPIELSSKIDDIATGFSTNLNIKPGDALEFYIKSTTVNLKVRCPYLNNIKTSSPEPTTTGGTVTLNDMYKCSSEVFVDTDHSLRWLDIRLLSTGNLLITIHREGSGNPQNFYSLESVTKIKQYN